MGCPVGAKKHYFGFKDTKGIPHDGCGRFGKFCWRPLLGGAASPAGGQWSCVVASVQFSQRWNASRVQEGGAAGPVAGKDSGNGGRLRSIWNDHSQSGDAPT